MLPALPGPLHVVDLAKVTPAGLVLDETALRSLATYLADERAWVRAADLCMAVRGAR